LQLGAQSAGLGQARHGRTDMGMRDGQAQRISGIFAWKRG
jgi:hypothetical protein